MEIKVKKQSGSVNINSKHIINYIAEKVSMVAGVKHVGNKNRLSFIKKLLKYNEDSIKIYPLGHGLIGVEVHVILNKGVNFTTISTQIQEIIMFKLKEKFGITVSFVDVVIEGTE